MGRSGGGMRIRPSEFESGVRIRVLFYGTPGTFVSPVPAGSVARRLPGHIRSRMKSPIERAFAVGERAAAAET